METSEGSGVLEKGRSEESQKQQQQNSGTSDKSRELILPQFCDMAQYLAERAVIRMESAASRYVIGNHTLPFSPASFVEVRHFYFFGSRNFLLEFRCQNMETK